MKEYSDFKELFYDICLIKQIVLKLRGEDLRKYKCLFYAQKFPMWRLDLLWEFIFDDKSYEEIQNIFKKSRLI